MTDVTLVFKAGNMLGEGPTWSEEEQALYWVGIIDKRVHRLEPASGAFRTWDMPDFTAAMDALFKRAEDRQRSVASLLAEVFRALTPLSPQNTVHAKTLYSAVNILLRVPPGPLFAELVRHSAFQSVGDHYWQFIQNRWQSD